MSQSESSGPGPLGFVPALRFRWLTPLYDTAIRLTMRERLLRQELIDSIALQPGMSVLDIGCGTGTLTIQMKQAEPLATVVGLDPDADVLQIASKKAAKAGVHLGFKQGSASSLPFEEAVLDVLVSSLAFHHLNPSVKRMALSESYRVLRPGGRLWIADFGPPRTRIGMVATLPIRMLDGKTTSDNFLGRMPGLIEGAGFSHVAEVERFYTIFGPVCFYAANKKGDQL